MYCKNDFSTDCTIKTISSTIARDDDRSNEVKQVLSKICIKSDKYTFLFLSKNKNSANDFVENSKKKNIKIQTFQ